MEFHLLYSQPLKHLFLINCVLVITQIQQTLQGCFPQDMEQMSKARRDCSVWFVNTSAHLEGVLFQRWDDVSEQNLGRQRVTVIHDGFAVAAFPAVHLHTAAASLQGPTNTHTVWWINPLCLSPQDTIIHKQFSAFDAETEYWVVPSLDVSLQAAVSSQLVLQQVGVVRGGDEVVAERLAHVLVELSVLRFENGALLWAEVHLEAIEGHGALLLGCADGVIRMVLEQTYSPGLTGRRNFDNDAHNEFPINVPWL